MNRNEAFDKIIKYLYNHPNNKLDLIANRENSGVNDRTLILSICDEMIERGWAKSYRNNYDVSITYEGQQIIEKYGSYSSFIDFEKVAQKKAQRSKITPDVIKIGIAIIFGLSTAILGWLNYIDDKKIDSQQIEIELLNKTIDSLNTELKKRDTIKS